MPTLELKLSNGVALSVATEAQAKDEEMKEMADASTMPTTAVVVVGAESQSPASSSSSAGSSTRRLGELAASPEARMQRIVMEKEGSIHREAHQVHEVERPDLSGWTGGSIWESGRILCEILSLEPHRVQGKRVLVCELR